MDDDENDPYPIGADLERRFYLSSKRLMIYFTNQVFDEDVVVVVVVIVVIVVVVYYVDSCSSTILPVQSARGV